MKKTIKYSYYDSSNELIFRSFSVDPSEIQAIVPCSNEKHSEIFLKGGKSFSVKMSQERTKALIKKEE